jgi:hypothetical protein
MWFHRSQTSGLFSLPLSLFYFYWVISIDLSLDSEVLLSASPSLIEFRNFSFKMLNFSNLEFLFDLRTNFYFLIFCIWLIIVTIISFHSLNIISLKSLDIFVIANLKSCYVQHTGPLKDSFYWCFPIHAHNFSFLWSSHFVIVVVNN